MPGLEWKSQTASSSARHPQSRGVMRPLSSYWGLQWWWATGTEGSASGKPQLPKPTTCLLNDPIDTVQCQALWKDVPRSAPSWRARCTHTHTTGPAPLWRWSPHEPKQSKWPIIVTNNLTNYCPIPGGVGYGRYTKGTMLHQLLYIIVKTESPMATTLWANDTSKPDIKPQRHDTSDHPIQATARYSKR